MSKLCIRLSLLLILFSMQVLAWGYHDAMDYGSPLVCVTPISSAMGGVWSLPSGGSASIFLNPAELSLLDGTHINATTGIVQWHTYSYGSAEFHHHQSGTTFSGATASIGFGISDRISFGAGVSGVSNFDFDGENLEIEITGPGIYEVPVIDNLDSRGSLWEVNTGLSFDISDWLIAGVSGGVRSGSGSYTLVRNVMDPSVQDDTTSVDWDATDFCAHVGVLMPLDFGTFGISGTNASTRYRSRVAVGFQKELEILNGSTLGIEFDVQSIENDNRAISGRFFGYFSEMIRNVRSIYSVGFDRARDYHLAALCLSTGASIKLGDVNLDMAISWRSRSRAGYSFTDANLEHIDDSGTYYNIGMNWKL